MKIYKINKPEKFLITTRDGNKSKSIVVMDTDLEEAKTILKNLFKSIEVKHSPTDKLIKTRVMIYRVEGAKRKECKTFTIYCIDYLEAFNVIEKHLI